MCTVVVSIAPQHRWPIAIAANRDEMLDRPWDAPAAWWPDQPDVVGGRDRLAGGTWLAVNQNGVVACVLNRVGTLGPASDKRSRGELPLLALRHANAASSVSALCTLDAGLWRGFNMLVADATQAFFVRGMGAGKPESIALSPGCHMVTAHDVDDFGSPRIARHLPRFVALPHPSPEDWTGWRRILSDSTGTQETQLNRLPIEGFGTASSAMVFTTAERTCFLFAPAAPDRALFRLV